MVRSFGDDPALVPFHAINRAIRRAWRAAGRKPTWPATIDPSVVRRRKYPLLYGVFLSTYTRLTPHLAQIGYLPDAHVARQVPCSRQTISDLRLALRMPVRQGVPVTSRMEAQCRRRILAREELKTISASLRLPYSWVRRLAKTMGWKRSWSKRRHPARSDTVGIMPLREALTLLRDGVTRTEIGRRAGVSHQRIAQIAKLYRIERTTHHAVIRSRRGARGETPRGRSASASPARTGLL